MEHAKPSKINIMLKRALSLVLCLAMCMGMMVYVAEEVEGLSISDPSGHTQYKIIEGCRVYFGQHLQSRYHSRQNVSSTGDITSYSDGYYTYGNSRIRYYSNGATSQPYRRFGTGTNNHSTSTYSKVVVVARSNVSDTLKFYFSTSDISSGTLRYATQTHTTTANKMEAFVFDIPTGYSAGWFGLDFLYNNRTSKSAYIDIFAVAFCTSDKVVVPTGDANHDCGSTYCEVPIATYLGQRMVAEWVLNEGGYTYKFNFSFSNSYGTTPSSYSTTLYKKFDPYNWVYTKNEDTASVGYRWDGTANPSRSGYTFKGWQISSLQYGYEVIRWNHPHEGSSGINDDQGAQLINGYCSNLPDPTYYLYTVGTTAALTSSVTLKSVFEQNKYTVSYNANGGSGAPSAQTKTHGTNLTLSSTKPTRTGYTFQGWGTSSSDTSVDYAAGATYSTDKAITLYAIWKINTWTVSYNANGGSGAPAAQTKTYNQSLTLSSTKPTRTGYTFQGWGTSSSDTSVDYAAGATYTANAGATLYAIWKINTWTVSYNANGGSGAPAAQTKTYNQSLTLSSTKPTKTGYTFSHWNTKSDGTGTTYQSGGSYTGNAALTLYAIYNINTWTVSYNANGGSGAPAAQTKTYNQSLTLSSTKPTKTGYTFSHWNTKSDGTGTTYQSGGSYTGNAALTLYAIYNINTWTVSYNANGGSGAPAAQTKTYNQSLTLSSTKPARTGYTFQGWNTAANGSGTAYAAGASYTANSAATLYAQWTPIEYKISYTLNGGTVSGTNPTKYTVETADFTLYNPTREGYTFAGWTGPDLTSASTSVTVKKGSTGDRIYTANWNANAYTITFNDNGGTGGPGTQTKYHDTDLTISSTVPTREGWEFVGWGTSDSDTTVDYAAGADYTANSGTTLYAIWKKTVTVTFNPNGGTGGPTSISGSFYHTDSKVSLTLPDFQPSRDGYVFYGWHTNQGAASKAYSPNGNYSISESITLYAIWKKEFTVFFDGDGDNVTGVPAPVTGLIFEAEYNSSTAEGEGKGVATIPTEIPSRPGYSFRGWNWTAGYDGHSHSAGKTYDNFSGNDVTLYAIWESTGYTVTWKNWDGTVLETDEGVEPNTVPSFDGATPTKAATAEYTYTFAGWTPKIVAATGDAVYTATYTAKKNTYTITWIVDGEETTEELEYGAMPSRDDPTKAADAQYTYTFTGWDKEIATVTGDATYMAVFDKTVNKYTIKWVGGDGETLKTEQVEYGKIPEYSGDAPTKTATAQYTYAFKGWDKEITTVTGDATYTAVFDKTLNKYTITWVFGNGAKDVVVSLEYGEMPQQVAPERVGFNFIGWSPEITEVIGDATYTAIWELATSSLTIKNTNAQLINDADQSFIFTVEGKDENANINLVVVLHGTDESVTVNGVPHGEYTVKEVSNWGWRYEISVDGSGAVTVDAEKEEVGVSISAKQAQWLSGDSRREYQFLNPIKIDPNEDDSE